MATLTLHVFRIQCERKVQSSLFAEREAPSEVISQAIFAKPTAVVRRGTEWHIGSPERIKDTNGIGFQIGRVQSVNTPQFDDNAKVFFESDEERAPYTIGVFDRSSQACGILRRSGVSLNGEEISDKLQKLLNESGIPSKYDYNIIVDKLRDPDEFIDIIRSSFQIKKFSFRSRFENAFDVQRLIQRPAQEFTEITKGRSTTVEVEGDSLEPEPLEELTRSVASVGDTASATVRSDENSKPRRIFLQGTPLIAEVSREEVEQSPLHAAFFAVKAAYKRLRQAE
jgi:hypothetical protein